MSEIDLLALRATYQSASHYQEAIGVLELADKTQKKVFFGDDGEIRLASWWDRLSEIFFSLFGYVDHTNQTWVKNSIKTFMAFGQERWQDDAITKRIQAIAEKYGIAPVRSKEAQATPMSQRSAEQLAENPLSKLPTVSISQEKTTEQQEVAEEQLVEELTKMFEQLAADPRFSHIKASDMESPASDAQAEKTEKRKPGWFSWKKLFVLGLALFGGNKLWTWKEQENALAVYQDAHQTGNLTSILQSPQLPDLPQGYKWLDLAVDQQDPDLVPLLLKRGAKSDWDLLFNVAETSDQGMFVALMQNGGVDLKASDKNGQNLLHAAAINPDLEMLNYLLDQPRMNALINKQATVALNPDVYLWNATPLARAAIEGMEDHVKLLLERGADPGLKCQLNGKTYNVLELATLTRNSLPAEDVDKLHAFDRIIQLLKTR